MVDQFFQTEQKLSITAGVGSHATKRGASTVHLLLTFS